MTATKKSSALKEQTVQEVISNALDGSELTLAEVAERAGFNNHNIVSMIKHGRTKLAAPRARPLAAALGLDPDMLLRLVLKERSPEIWEALEPMLERATQTDNEMAILKIVREEAAGRDVKPQTAAQELAFREEVRKWVRGYMI